VKDQFDGAGILTENDEQYHGKGMKSGIGHIIYDGGDSYHGW